ncbi:N-acetyldiaminopimelate deacetylase [Paenibacillus elgii]|uniref:N-acetyldiaminopimelate deacetylase n=1 Tax=Paenibacillus elgii TaxID=189691 RepID=A0A163WIC5_9BACL|nr:N-acetyldiaminopimelate deacetylase [Paenibacillus elgii]KZE76400.1 N-acetyldiaminopimelate deacetylase [Paenibacillus elgii]NEN83336.1 N-acetyldiaminopimelate deacetylase [Paenibacillus elgii]PUA38871.1 N-acetyldiaminopimelate deacetylase [Paenibacillus elgii]
MSVAVNPSRFVQIRRDLHKIPELGFQEFKTQRYLLDYIASLPQERLEVRTWRTGIIVNVKGTAPKRRFGYRADIDALPITEDTGYDFRSEHPGFMHACGHDLHMSIGLGILTHFAQQPIRDNLTFIFQPAEEGPGGAKPMLECEELRDWMPDEIFALHIAPEYPVGTVATKPGILFANTSELFITLTGKGGHAAFPHNANDMVIAACQLVGQLQTVISRNVNPLDSAVITIGKIDGGTKQNIIAETARLEGTIRTLSAETMSLVKSRIEALVAGMETAFACKAEIDYGANYRQVFNEADVTGQFMNWVRDTDHSMPLQLIECTEAMTGEDFGYFLEAVPGFMFWLGVGTPYGLHHAKLEPDERAIDLAIDLMSRFLTWKSQQ